MPRMIRDWTDSESVNKLSAEAERFFTRLIMKADDFGRFVGNPKLLSSSLFPLQEYSIGQLETWINECINCNLLIRYTVEQKTYVEIRGFNQNGLKVRRAKYPPSSPEERIELVTGYVYIIGESFLKPVKIGFSMNPWSRIKEINANHPEVLSILMAFKAEKRTESLIHLALKSIKVKNEWFQLTDFEIDAFKAVEEGILTNENLINLLRSNYETLRTTTHPEREGKRREVEEETEIEKEGNQYQSFGDYSPDCKYLIIDSRTPGIPPIRINGVDGLSDYMQASGSVLNWPEYARKFMTEYNSDHFEDLRHVRNAYKKYVNDLNAK